MVRFGIVGTGKITEEFVSSVRVTGVAKSTAVYSRSAETGMAYAARHGIDHAFASLEAMLDSGTVDAVYIASPNALHAPQATICLERGFPVLVEKPAASNVRELDAVLALSAQKGVAYMEALKSTLVPAFDAVRAHLPKLGRIRHYFSSFCQYSSRYDAFLAGEYRTTFDPALSNGSLMDIGVYCLYPAIHLFGAPRSIQAMAQRLSTGVDGGGSLILDYGDMDAVIVHSKNSSSWLPTEIQGEAATLRINKISQPKTVEILFRDGWVEEIPVEMPEPFMCYEIREFVKLVEAGRTQSDINTHALSREVLRVMDEARRQTGIVYPADGMDGTAHGS